MKAKKCSGQDCNYIGSLWKAKCKEHDGLCKNCALKRNVEINGVKSSFKTTEKPKASKDDKSIPELLKLAQIVFNKWIRKRDSVNGYFTCISSGDRLPIDQMDAGHFFPVSTSSFLRFNEDNVHGESISANRFDPYHETTYRNNLVAKIGRARVEALLKAKNETHKWDKEELLEIISKYKI